MEKLTEKKFWEGLKRLKKYSEDVIVFYQKNVEVGCIDSNEYISSDYDIDDIYSIEDIGDGVFRINCNDMSLFADSYKIYEP